MEISNVYRRNSIVKVSFLVRKSLVSSEHVPSCLCYGSFLILRIHPSLLVCLIDEFHVLIHFSTFVLILYVFNHQFTHQNPTV